MGKIGSKNTAPELHIRKSLFAMGFRYRINDKRLAGSPDIVFPKHRALVFVHGCFWHGHDCEFFRLPGTNSEFWKEKIENNRERDAKVLNLLHAEGWRLCIVWECAIKGKTQLQCIADTTTCIADWILSDNPWLEVRKERIESTDPC